MSGRVVAVVQARMGSSRLPGKSLMALANKPMLAHVLERVKATPGVDEVVLATSATERDAPLCDLAASVGVRAFTGSEWDVLERMRDAARNAQADTVVRVTGDCPFFDPQVAADVLNLYRLSTASYVWNDTATSGYPDGLDVEVFGYECLDLATKRAMKREDREHVTPWMRRSLPTDVLRHYPNLSRYKLSVDTRDDFDFATEVHRFLIPGDFSMAGTVAAVEFVRRLRA